MVFGECTDSDGSNYYLKGKITNSLNNENYNDACVSKIDAGNVQYYVKIGDALYKNLASCYGDNCYVAEAVCSEGETIWNKWEAFKCNNGCKDGACLNESIVVPEPFCSDSDGLNYFLKGSVKDVSGERFDYCKNGDEGEYVAEYFCDGNTINNKPYLCANGCKDGACISNTTTDCKYLYWFDSKSKECKYNQFCGAYMYYGLRIFENKNDCERELNSIGCEVIDCASGYRCEKGKCILNPDNSSKVFEQVKCVFKDSKNEQKCYLGQGEGLHEGISCVGKDSCVMDVNGVKGFDIVWKSSCGGYQYTIQDGNSETIEFNCSSGEIDINNKGFRFSYWQCYDGNEQKSEDKSSCKLSETWQKYAKDYCINKCKGEKCGVNSFSVSQECYSDEIPPTEIFIETEDNSGYKEQILNPKEVLICKDSCPLNDKCYNFGYRKGGNYCSDENKFVEQLSENEKCDNNFECESNVCVNGKCLSQSLIEKILNWFRNLFG